jgi:hypothetical protein
MNQAVGHGLSLTSLTIRGIEESLGSQVGLRRKKTYRNTKACMRLANNYSVAVPSVTRM